MNSWLFTMSIMISFMIVTMYLLYKRSHFILNARITVSCYNCTCLIFTIGSVHYFVIIVWKYNIWGFFLTYIQFHIVNVYLIHRFHQQSLSEQHCFDKKLVRSTNILGLLWLVQGVLLNVFVAVVIIHKIHVHRYVVYNHIFVFSICLISSWLEVKSIDTKHK